MENKDFGNQIQDIVQNSLNNMDFKDLNKKIENTVNTTIAEVRKSLKLENGAAEQQPDRGVVEDAQGTAYESYREYNEREKARRREGAYGSARPDHHRTGNAGSYGQQRRWTEQSSSSTQGSSAAQAGRDASYRTQNGRPYKDREERQVPPSFSSVYRTKEEIQTSGSPRRSADVRREKRPVEVPISRNPYGRISSVLYIIFFGFMILGPLALTAMIWAMVAVVDGSSYELMTFLRVFLAVFLPLILISGGMTLRGISQRKRLKRFRTYVRELNGRSYISVKELAYRTNQSEKFLAKDLQKMIQHRMFTEGHLDRQNTCLMVTNEAYEQYLGAQNSLEERQRQAKIKAQEERQEKQNQERAAKEKAKGTQAASDLPEELRSVIAEGREYIRQMREANDAIPGGDISRKLTRLEIIIDKIFTHVEKHPEQTDELHKFMNYYLPTTLKLVNAYREFDAQPVQGENIRKAKQEIEDTLDTIISAFEKLFDSMFEDAAMDISTDISVLETMLAQEGLTGRDFADQQR